MIRPYTQYEIDFITDNLDLPNKKIAEAIGRTESGIKSFKAIRNLCKNRQFIPWQDYEKVVSLYFRLSENSVSAIAHITGFKKYKVDKIINEYLDRTWC